jgi:hypothetical protein
VKAGITGEITHIDGGQSPDRSLAGQFRLPVCVARAARRPQQRG